jgi:polyisoprenoid-binding protein YceI
MNIQASVVTVVATLTFSASAFAQVVVDLRMSPGGPFQAKFEEVKGEAYMSGDTVTAKNILVPVGTIKTGMSLRDRHAKDKYLEEAKYPNAELIEATGKGGTGRAKIKIHNVEKEVSGTYKIEGGKLMAEFPISLKEFNITGISYMNVGVADAGVVKVTVPVKAGAAPAPAAAPAAKPAAPPAKRR